MKVPVLQRTRDVGSGRTARDTEVLAAARLPASNRLTRPIIYDTIAEGIAIDSLVSEFAARLA
jgi:hypothetical protein